MPVIRALRPALVRAGLRLGTENRRVVIGGMTIFGFVLLGKSAGAAKEAAVAWRFGIGPVVDAYLFVFALVGLPVALWYSVLSAVYIPLAGRMAEDTAELARFRGELLGFTLAAGLLGGIVTWLGLTVLLTGGWSGLSPETRLIAQAAVPWLAMIVPLGIVTHYGSVLMMADGHHRNTLLEAVPSLTLLAAIALVPHASLYPLVAGSLMGAAFHAALLVRSFRRPAALFVSPRFTMRSPAWTGFRAAFGVMLLGQALQSATGALDQFFAAHQPGGAIASLGYANRLLSLVLSLSATVIGRALLPVFSGVLANDPARIAPLARRWSAAALVAGVAMMAVAWPLAERGVALLFQRGAFSAGDTAQVAAVLRFGLLQIPVYLVSVVLSQAAFATGRYRAALGMFATNLLLKLGLCAALVPLLGIGGLMVATAAMYAVSCVVLLRIVQR